MIILKNGQLNEFNITVSTPLAPGNYYQMVFSSDYAPGNIFTLFPSGVTQNARYTTFAVDCTKTNPDPLQGQITFVPTGTYSYLVNIVSSLSLTASVIETILTDYANVEGANAPINNNLYNFITLNGQL